ncbi:hypothetical protein MUO71_06390 [Candidatus Bathyarchaeota archaeon]|nr:hypothetical protein [Candidatus Bathyarchaeota archaeon]
MWQRCESIYCITNQGGTKTEGRHKGIVENAILLGGCEPKVTKKKFAGLLFGTLLIIGMAAMALQATSDIKEVDASDSSYTVITSNYSGIPYDLYCPTNFSGSFVLFAGGILGHKQYAAGWAAILAEEGYGVLTFSTPPEDLDNVPRYVDNCKNNIQTLLPFVFDPSIFPLSINEESVAVVGISGGGSAALSLNDPRIKTSVAICPYYVNNSSANNNFPVLIITGTEDYICPSDTHGLTYYNELETNKMIIEQAEVGHDMSPVGWKHLVAWLDYFANDETSAYSTLASANDDPEISFTSNDFSGLPPVFDYDDIV